MEIALKGYAYNSYVVSVDRVDSNKGYLKDNVVLCCDSVNTMKMKLDTKEFLNICNKIINHQTLITSGSFHTIDDTKN